MSRGKKFATGFWHYVVQEYTSSIIFFFFICWLTEFYKCSSLSLNYSYLYVLMKKEKERKPAAAIIWLECRDESCVSDL